MKKVLSVETILRYVDYDHVTGVFTSRVNRGIRIRIGKEAGHVFSVAGKRYRWLSVCGVAFTAHRLAWYIVHGSMPEGEIDHIDGNGLRDEGNGMNSGSGVTLADQVRDFLRASKVSQHEIARETGIKQPSLSKFMNGGSLKIETLEALMGYLQVGLYKTSRKKSSGRESKPRYGEDCINFGSELEGLEGQRFSTILIDPPWRFQNRTGKMAPEHRRLNRYETMQLDDIKRMPVAAHAASACHLYMWCPNALLKEGLEVMEAWGFKYKTNLVWYKVRKDGGPDGRGVGFYFRNVTELILFGLRGSMRTLGPGRRQVNVISTRKREHSRKPSETYELIERCSPGPYLEIFAREKADGWVSWGNEVDTYEENRPLHRGYNNNRSTEPDRNGKLPLTFSD